MQADGIVENYVGGSSVEEIVENFNIPAEVILAVLQYAAKFNSAIRV